MALERKTINGLVVDHAPGTGPKVLFVHGSGAGAWNWENFMQQFSAAGYDCYAMNLRGHAPNPQLPELGAVVMADYVQDVRGVLREIGEDIILVGHSMGGAIAQMVAQDVPVRALVLASSAPVAGVKFQNPSFNVWFLLHIIRTIPAMVRKKPIPLGWKVMRSAVLNKIPEDQQRAAFEKFVPESGAVGMEVLKGTISADLTQAKFPILVVSGNEDNTSLIAMEREIAAQQKADLIELDGHGHMFMIEPGWQECGKKIMNWIESKGVRAAA
jgi:pimeloyl-ACP methyl ester carboxylesterase